MFINKRYPKLFIRSKNELAKRISNPKLSFEKALSLINDVAQNFSNYWYDSAKSEPEKEKFVRSARGTPLGKLLELIDKKILAPNDYLVPDFLFGGLSKRSHVQAAHHLLGHRRQRVLLGIDIRRFFEQVKKLRVFYFFYKKCGCSKKLSNLLANLLCVPKGQKIIGNQTNQVLARGFATSPRLAIWCNLDTFLRLNWSVKKVLKRYDPRISIFVDDIGISASRLGKDDMEKIFVSSKDILEKFDPNQELPVNPQKKKIKLYSEGIEHLGLNIGKNKLYVGRKTLSKKDKIRNKLKEAMPVKLRQKLKRIKKSYYNYEKQIEKINLGLK